MPEDAVVAALLAALAAQPDNAVLRRHLAQVLLDAGRAEEAATEVGRLLAADPSDVSAIRLAARAARAAGRDAQADAHDRVADALEGVSSNAGSAAGASSPDDPGRDSDANTPSRPGDPAPERPLAASVSWGVVPDTADDLMATWGESDAPAEPEIGHLSAASVSLADVGGLADVKKRLHSSFLAPLRNPEMRTAFGKSLRGGLLLWGPPGCGKTFVARALAGELGANFYEVGISDVLDMYIGNSERNISSIFDAARRNRPCLIFFDEIDALGQKRTHLRGNSAMRGVVNQMLAELDGATRDNEGVFVLAATNHPWDVDSALVRPGRFDRRVLVTPPDLAAREAILRLHLRDRPVERLDLAKIAKATEGYSGADLALICEQATEEAMEASMSSGRITPITQRHLADAAKSVRPSIGEWLESARNYALYSNESGAYDELLPFLKGRWR